jgi:hypothetical protein
MDEERFGASPLIRLRRRSPGGRPMSAGRSRLEECSDQVELTCGIFLFPSPDLIRGGDAAQVAEPGDTESARKVRHGVRDFEPSRERSSPAFEKGDVPGPDRTGAPLLRWFRQAGVAALLEAALLFPVRVGAWEALGMPGAVSPCDKSQFESAEMLFADLGESSDHTAFQDRAGATIGPLPLTRLVARSRSQRATLSHKGRGKRVCGSRKAIRGTIQIHRNMLQDPS